MILARLAGCIRACSLYEYRTAPVCWSTIMADFASRANGAGRSPKTWISERGTAGASFEAAVFEARRLVLVSPAGAARRHTSNRKPRQPTSRARIDVPSASTHDLKLRCAAEDRKTVLGITKVELAFRK